MSTSRGFLTCIPVLVRPLSALQAVEGEAAAEPKAMREGRFRCASRLGGSLALQTRPSRSAEMGMHRRPLTRSDALRSIAFGGRSGILGVLTWRSDRR